MRSISSKRLLLQTGRICFPYERIRNLEDVEKVEKSQKASIMFPQTQNPTRNSFLTVAFYDCWTSCTGLMQ